MEKRKSLCFTGGSNPEPSSPQELVYPPRYREKGDGRTSSRDASITDTHQIAQDDLCHSLAMLQRYFLQFLIFQ
jgi:hypothetical protein